MLERQGVGKVQPPIARQRMAGRHHHRQMVATPRPVVQPAQVGRVPANAERCAALAHAAQHLGADGFFHVDADVAVRRHFQEGRHVIGQRFGDGRLRGHHAHVAAHAGRVAGHVALDLRRAGEQGARVLQQRVARRRGLDAMAAPHQKRRAHRVFQRRQPLADGRADDGLLLGGARNAARLAHGDKETQAGQVKVAHCAPPYGAARLPPQRGDNAGGRGNPGHGVPAWPASRPFEAASCAAAKDGETAVRFSIEES